MFSPNREERLFLSSKLRWSLCGRLLHEMPTWAWGSGISLLTWQPVFCQHTCAGVQWWRFSTMTTQFMLAFGLLLRILWVSRACGLLAGCFSQGQKCCEACHWPVTGPASIWELSPFQGDLKITILSVMGAEVAGAGLERPGCLLTHYLQVLEISYIWFPLSPWQMVKRKFLISLLNMR